MATRTVTTVFAVEGENKYKEAVRQINSVLQELNSEMKLTSERFAGQEGSLEALADKQRILEDMYQSQSDLAGTYADKLSRVQDSMRQMQEEADNLRDVLGQLDGILYNTAQNTTSYDEAVEEYRRTADELSKIETDMARAAVEANNLQTGINNAHTEMGLLTRQLQELDPYLDEARESTDQYAHSLDSAGEAADDMAGRSLDALEAIASSEAYDRIRDAFRAVADMMRDCVTAYTEFETAIAGVEKTVDATDEQMDRIVEGIRSLATEIPASTTEIAAVAEAAGQLGIATEDLLDFTEVMIKLGTSTNLSAEEAASALAKFANITQMDTSDYERLGSTIVDLGNNAATTEADIIEMATRLAATGELVGLTEAQILAMATAFSALGIEAEAGGSASAKLLKKLETAVQTFAPSVEIIEQTGYTVRELELLQANQNKVFKETADEIGVTSTELGKYIGNVKLLNQIAEISGTTADEFISAWGNDAVVALDLFVTGLGRMDEAGESAVQALSEIAGMSEVRLSNAILAMASSGGLLTETLGIASTAWEENAALSEEAAKRYETTESKIVILQNAFGNLKTAIGEDYGTALNPIIEGLTEIANSAADAAEEGPALASVLSGIGGGLAGITAVAGAGTVIKVVASGLAAFGGLAGPIGITATAIGVAAGALGTYITNTMQMPEATQAILDTNEKLVEATQAIETEFAGINSSIDTNKDKTDALIQKLRDLMQAMDDTPASQAIIQSVVDQLNQILPGLGLTYDGVTDKINLTTAAIQDFANKANEAARTEAFQTYIAELTEKQVDLEVQQRITNEAVAEAKAAYDAATEAEQAYLNELTLVEKALAITNPQYIALAEEVSQTKNAYFELVKSQEKVQEALDETNANLDTAVSAYENFVKEVESTVSAVKDVGRNAAQGFIDGLKEKEEAVGYAAQRLARGALDQMAEELDIHSPSRKSRRLGNFFGEGMVEGIDDKAGEIEAAVQRMSERMDLSDALAGKVEAANREMQKLRTEMPAVGTVGVYTDPAVSMAAMEETMRMYRAGNTGIGMGSERVPVQVNIIQELDGKEVSRSVSGIQWAENEINIRAAGVTV